jgi:hypothetical protein
MRKIGLQGTCKVAFCAPGMALSLEVEVLCRPW